MNGVKLAEDTFGQKCGTGHFIGGVVVARDDSDGSWRVEGRTVEDGLHKALCEFRVTPDGKMIEGTANLFALPMGKLGKHGDSWFPADVGYFDMFVEEFFAQDQKWDEVK